MHRLYEKFVLSYYRQHHPGFAPRAAYIEWDLWAIPTDIFAGNEDDITMSNGVRQLIIDTKYYTQYAVNSRFDNTTFISENIYQIYTYVKNSTRRN